MLDNLFSLDASLVDTEAGQQAKRQGLLLAKREALKTAQRLSKCGRPLQFGVLFVSFVHIFSELAAIKPAMVGGLRLPDEVFHASAGAFTFAIDLVALYVISSASVAAYIGQKNVGYSRFFFYALTALLNGAFVLSFMPGLPSELTQALPAVRAIVAVLLALLVPVSLASVESSHRLAEHTRLGLLAETTVLESLLKDHDPIAEARKELEDLREQLDTQGQQFSQMKVLAENYQRMYQDEVQRANKLSESLQAEVEDHGDTRAKLADALARIEELERKLEEQPVVVQPVDSFTWRPIIEAQPLDQGEPPMSGGFHEPKSRQQGTPVMTCEVCHVGELDATEKGIAGRASWKRKFNGKYACRDCRNKAV